MKNFKSKVIKNIVLPLADRAMKTKITTCYKELYNMKNFSPDQIIDWQNKHLKNLLEHAYHNTVYYNKIFNQAGILPQDITTKEELNKLPVLSKEIIKSNFNDLLPSNIQNFPYKVSATGGSTGNPLKYYLDNVSWSMSTANNLINWEETGYRYGDKYLALGSTSLFVNKKTSFKHNIYYKIKNKKSLNGINMSNEICAHYIDIIKKENIRFIYGYASSIYLLAKYALKNNQKLEIQGVFSTSEVLSDNFRDVIDNAFQCDIVNCYGAFDGSLTAFEHDKDYFKVGYNSLVIMGPSSNSKQGPILVTDLFNYSMPFINYELGDEIEMNEDRNKIYDYNGQIINKVLGRTSDILSFSNGRVITGPGFTILFKDLPVDYYCIEKKSNFSVFCWVIKSPEFGLVHERKIIETLNKQLGENIEVELKYIDKPFLSNSGKRKYFIDSQ